MAVCREALYNEVWADPMLEVAERYGVSSSYLARVCRQLGIPTPPRGYWARLRVGVKMQRPDLPPPFPGDNIEWNQSGQAKTQPWPYPKPPSSFHRHPSTLANPKSIHPLVEQARLAFEGMTVGWLQEYLKPAKSITIDFHVSEIQRDRALDLGARQN